MTKSRIYFIDNLRIFLIALVALHHLSITYGASGGWFYKEVEGDQFTQLILTMFTATNQSFFMGFFFLISAYFTKLSIDRKSPTKFSKDRLIRLGIPLLFYYFILNPLTIYLAVKYGRGTDVGLIDLVRDNYVFGFGPLWFVETLILFSGAYLTYKQLFKGKSVLPETMAFPSTINILMIALIVVIVSFIVRLFTPLGSSIPYTGLQLPYFPQYLAMLILGIMAAKYNWFEKVTYKMGIRWFAFAQIQIFIAFPLVFIFGTKVAGLEPFGGGITWQSASLCLWEQLTGFSLMIGVTGIFKEKINSQGSLAKKLSGAAYTFFIIHATIVVGISVLFKQLTLYPVVKFIVLAPVVIIVCFGLSILIRKIPGFDKVL